MGSLVAGIAMSHAPLMQAESAKPPEDQEHAIGVGLQRLRTELAEAQPDLILAVIDDHFENFFRPLMPSFTVAVGSSNYGPPDHYVDWLGVQQREIANAPEFAGRLLHDLVGAGFDLTRAERVALGHALIVPMQTLRPEYDIPVVPLLTNVFTAPTPTISRAMELGRAIRSFVADCDERVAVIATGALSHWPPYWQPGDAPDPFLDRIRRLQEDGLSVLEDDPNLFVDFNIRENEMAAAGERLFNADWDRRALKAFADGEVDWLSSLSYDQVCRDGGHGGYEILNWAMLAAIMGGAPAEIVGYEAIREWIGGIGILRYDAQLDLGVTSSATTGS